MPKIKQIPSVDPENDKRKRRLLILGLLAQASNSKEGDVPVETIEKQLSDLGIMDADVRQELDEIITRYRWFGLAWTDPEKKRLATIAGVRWFANQSSMYEKLVDSKPEYRELARQFAIGIRELEQLYTNPRLLVDAGSTAFHCLFHEDCAKLRKRTQLLLTNNLFVALRWQEEFQDQGKVQLIGGVPNLDTAATVDNEKLSQWLSAQSRRPHVSLLSWHYVVPDAAGGVTMYTKDERESEMKKAIMENTAGVVYVVWNRKKITTQAPEGGEPYKLSELLKSQKEDMHLKRWVYLITDIEKPEGLEKQLVANLTQEDFLKNRVKFICPAVNK